MKIIILEQRLRAFKKHSEFFNKKKTPTAFNRLVYQKSVLKIFYYIFSIHKMYKIPACLKFESKEEHAQCLFYRSVVTTSIAFPSCGAVLILNASKRCLAGFTSDVPSQIADGRPRGRVMEHCDINMSVTIRACEVKERDSQDGDG